MLLEQAERKNGMFRHVTTSQHLTVNNSNKCDEPRWRQINPKSTCIAGPPPRWDGLCLYLCAQSHTTMAPGNKITFSSKYRQTYTTTVNAVTKLLKKLVLKT